MESDAARSEGTYLGRRKSWQPYHEPFASTAARNVTLAVVIGGVVALMSNPA